MHVVCPIIVAASISKSMHVVAVVIIFPEPSQAASPIALAICSECDGVVQCDDKSCSQVKY
jgi:hypothetical protein